MNGLSMDYQAIIPQKLVEFYQKVYNTAELIDFAYTVHWVIWCSFVKVLYSCV